MRVPSVTFSTCYELQQPRSYSSGVTSLLMRPDRQLWAFNAEVTASPGVAPLPCFHGWPTVATGALFVNPRVLLSPRHGLWALYEVGLLNSLVPQDYLRSLLKVFIS